MSATSDKRIIKTTALAKAWKTAVSEKERSRYAEEICKLLKNTIRAWVYKLKIQDKEDLIQEYYLKIFECLKNYNPEESNFETYLYWHWKKAREEHSYKTKTVKPPYRVNGVSYEYNKETGDIDLKEIKEKFKIYFNSLNTSRPDGFEDFKEDDIYYIKDKDVVLDEAEKIINHFQKNHIINDFESKVLRNKILSEISLYKMSKGYECSRQHLCDVYRGALEKIKKHLNTRQDKFI